VTSGPEVGAEVGGYTLESVLGRGGMGVVYLARNKSGGLCAMKVLSRRLVGDDPSFAARFKREVKYAEALEHPHVLEIYEAGETPDGTLYFAMQYVAGADLGELLRRDGVLDLARALAILGQVADALDYAHSRGLVHRDIKPANIIVADDAAGPHAYLTDFGVSKNRAQDSVALTRAGQMIGTLPYTAPEEILATEPRDDRVDLYSLGCVLYESLVGAPPFVRERDLDVLYAHIGDPRPSATAARPDLPAGIDEVIAKAMAISASDRYTSCVELIDAVRALVPAGDQATAAPPGAESPSAEITGLRLVVTSGLGNGRAVDVEDELVLGREDMLDGVFEADQSISRRHARVRRLADGTYVVEDEHSRNGTFVNGERVDAPRVLRTGDELRIGAAVFVATVPEVSTPVVAEVSSSRGRLSLRLQLDPDAGELVVAVEDGATVRIVRGDDGWRVEP
jgi:predicted Ser/Thr protein kinase